MWPPASDAPAAPPVPGSAKMPGRVPRTGLDRPGSSLTASPASPASSSWLAAVSAILTPALAAAARELDRRVLQLRVRQPGRDRRDPGQAGDHRGLIRSPQSTRRAVLASRAGAREPGRCEPQCGLDQDLRRRGGPGPDPAARSDLAVACGRVCTARGRKRGPRLRRRGGCWLAGIAPQDEMDCEPVLASRADPGVLTPAPLLGALGRRSAARPSLSTDAGCARRWTAAERRRDRSTA
jgi:hypothetical protein